MSLPSILRRSASAAFGMARRALRASLGELSWNPPPWARALARSPQQHPARAAAVAVLLPLLAVGGYQARLWYLTRPQPKAVQVKVSAPGIATWTRGQPLRISPLEVSFSGPIARLENLQRVIKAGVRLEPEFAGRWEWRTDSRLVFTPREDWPADTAFRILIEPTAIVPEARLTPAVPAFRTPAFTASLSAPEFYVDPTQPAIRQITTTITLSHATELAELARAIDIRTVGESSILRTGADGRTFTITPGEQQRQYFLRTNALALPEREDFLNLTVRAGLTTRQGGARTAADVMAKVRVPDLYSLFSVAGVDGMIVPDKAGDPTQVLMLRVTASAKPAELQKGVELFLLPARNPRITPAKSAEPEESTEGEESDESEGEPKPPKVPDPLPLFDDWNAGEVTDEVLAQSERLPLNALPAAHPTVRELAFRFRTPREGRLFVRVRKGLAAEGGFILRENYTAAFDAPMPPRSVSIQGDGGVLALTGERKLAMRSLGVPLIEYEIAQVPADQINHLVSQTSGSFSDPDFRGSAFSRENLARIATERQPVAMKNRSEPDFAAFDLSRHLQAPGTEKRFRQGLFFLRARGIDPRTDKPFKEAAEAGRFLLVTDLGLIVKANADGSREVFAASLKSRAPATDVTVEILARNGTVLASASTGTSGRASLPSVDKLTRDQKPVAIVARRGDDTAFLPYAARDRGLDFSRFETGGVAVKSGAELDAFLFTERGVYRPGDTVRIGALTHRRDWQPAPEGVPLELEVIDPSGTKKRVAKLTLPAGGFSEASFPTAPESPTGDYLLRLHLLKDGKRSGVLAEEPFWVKEFLPETMKLAAQLSKSAKRGWVTPEAMKAALRLENLYGVPASDRRVKARLELSPSGFSFPEFADWNFFDPLRDGQKTRKEQTVELGEKQTDATGNSEFDLDLARFADATYALRFRAEGFEAESGRSVAAGAGTLVSPLEFVAGWKPDGDLDTIQAGADRTLRFIVLDRELQQIASGPLKLRLIQRIYLSTLSKADNGSYRYESVREDREIVTQTVEIPREGWSYALPTKEPGEFELSLFDAEGRRIAVAGFGVIGAGRGTRTMDKNAELQLKLAGKEFKAGDVVEIGINAPYTGGGLITLEREKVFAHTWFRADTTSSVQRLRIPDDFDGTGYINVCFVRALDSREIFASPLSYAVQAVTVNRAARRLAVELGTAASAKPGETLKIRHRTSKPAKIVVFAVDQGILQVSDYQLPNPLTHFFRRAALGTGTTQFLDQLLPEFSLVRAMSATGGGDDVVPKTLNPFRRVTDEPVVFWSGVIDSGPTAQEVSYVVPDYFNGTLAVMAVALAADAVGAAETKSLVRGSFVINPSIPTVAAPGDEFEAGITIANNVDGSGENAPVRLAFELSEHLELAAPPPAELKISEGREASFTVRVRVKDALGSAQIVLRATSASGEESRSRATLSVRPATAFRVQLRSGRFTSPTVDAPIERRLYPQFRRGEATLSALPLGLARGLETFLREYPHGCTEQQVSGALARMALADEADFGLSRTEAAEMVAKVCATLRQRQNADGTFGYWATGTAAPADPTTVHAVLFLIEAKAAGFAPPDDLLQRALGALRKTAALEPGSLRDARTIATAIHLLTREGVVTTNYLLNLRDWLTRRFPDGAWQRDLAAVQMAAALALLKKTDEAGKLITEYRLGGQPVREWWDFHSNLSADAQYAAILATHFPAMLRGWKPADLEALLQPITNSAYNTYSAAHAVLALKAYARVVKASAVELSLQELNAGGQTTNVPLTGGAVLKRGAFTPGAAKLRFGSKGGLEGMASYFQVMEAGYDLRPPETAAAEGLEVTREWRTPKGGPVENVRLGDTVVIRVRARSKTGAPITNVAVVDLLPCGFEIAEKSLEPGANQHGMDFIEVREDRVVFFGTLNAVSRMIEYRIKPTARGNFTVPPIAAESMYDRTLNARGIPSRITVVAP